VIVSHSNKFIFFAVPKTATHSVRLVLQNYLSSDDWQQQALFRDSGSSPQTLPIETIARVQHGHITAQQIQPELDSQVWRDYLKFGFVRNPYDRFISVCFFLNRQNAEFSDNSLAWMKSALSHPRFQQRVLVRPQIEQLVDSTGEIALDIIGRYESLQASLDEILQILNLNRISLEVKNSSKHDHYREHYDDELREMVSTFYTEDLRRFNYHY
jgi:hypothetical protein